MDDEAQLDTTLKPISGLQNFLEELGPGLITGAADDDPSGISTYSVAGASFGYATLWTALLSFPLMAAVQLMCARLGMVTGCGLASVIRTRIHGGCCGSLVPWLQLRTSSILAQILAV
jgi:Mn2+/Fe2+ NRAMP family transporter